MTDAATMRKISYWRYSAVNRKTLFAALACALLVFSMLGCGTTNHLQSIQLSTSNTSETPMNGLNVPGISSTLQLYVWENTSNGKAVLLHGEGIAYQIVLDPDNFVDAFGNVLPAPPQVLNLSTTGLITGIDPAVCTWVDVAGIIPPATTAPPPVWQLSGSYNVTATFGGFTTPPVNIGVGSGAGDPNNPNLPGTEGVNNNPSGLCNQATF
jgi:hypothetical protein